MTHPTETGSAGPDPATMAGLDVLRAIREAPEHGPSIARFLGMELESVEEGRATFVIAARPEYANPLGSLHGGIYATVLDSAMACAVHSRLAAGVRYGTLEMKINFLRTVPTDGSLLRATGTVIHLGRSTALAEGTIADERGRIVAHGTETCMIYG